MALKYAGITVEHREIELRNKPSSMLQASPKGTVPVLLVEGRVIDQSLEIMHWALEQSDPDGWQGVDEKMAQEWLEKNDGLFKKLLDQYKYPNRHPDVNPKEVLQSAMHLMLEPMELALQNHAFLMGAKLSWVDIAIFPFIRQFSMVNPQEFGGMSIPKVKAWLEQRIASRLFQAVMDKHPAWKD